MVEQKMRLVLQIQAEIEQAKKAIQNLGNAFSNSGRNNPLQNTLDELGDKLFKLQSQSKEPLDLQGMRQVRKEAKNIGLTIDEIDTKFKDLKQSGNENKLFNFFGDNTLNNIKTATSYIRDYTKGIKDNSKAIEKQKQEIASLEEKQKKQKVLTGNTEQINKSYSDIISQITKVSRAQNLYIQASEKNKKKKEEQLQAEQQKLLELVKIYNSLEGVQHKISLNKDFTLNQKSIGVNGKDVDLINKSVDSANELNNKIIAAKEELQKLTDAEVDSSSLNELKNELSEIGIELEYDGTESEWTKEKWIEMLQSFQNKKVSDLVKILDEAGTSLKDFGTQAKEIKEKAEQGGLKVQDMGNSVNYLRSQLSYLTGITGAIMVLRKALSQTIATVKELDATMTETAVVTEYTISDMWDQLPKYAQNAKELGLAINDVYQASTLYYQQGLNTNQVNQITTQTLKMARIAGLDAAEATDRMTAALRGFNMEINETNATNIADVYSKLAAISASNVNEISVAMSKVASLANSANMSFENTASFLTQIIETTRESAATAGTALKTVIARFAEIKENPALTADSEGAEISYNKIDAALKSVGISLDAFMQGQEGLDQVFIRLAERWDTLDTVTQRYIATQAAGSRQQSRFIAMMSDYKRTVELTTAAQNAAGASAKQYAKTTESLQTKIQNLKTEWQTFTMSLYDNKAIKSVIDIANGILTIFNKIADVIPGLRITTLVGVLVTAKPIIDGIFKSITDFTSGSAKSIAVLKNIKKQFSEITVLEKAKNLVIQNSNVVIKENNTLAQANTLLKNAEANGASKAVIAKAKEIVATKQETAAKAKLVAVNRALLISMAALAAFAVIRLVIKYTSLEHFKEKLEESNQTLEETKSKIDEINEKIAEINAKDGISLTDQDQLKLLEKEKTELEAIYAIEQKRQSKLNNTVNRKTLRQVTNTLTEAGSYLSMGDTEQAEQLYDDAFLKLTELDYNTLSEKQKEEYDKYYNQIINQQVSNGTITGQQYLTLALTSTEENRINTLLENLAKKTDEELNKIDWNNIFGSSTDKVLKAFGGKISNIKQHIRSLREEIADTEEVDTTFLDQIDNLKAISTQFTDLNNIYQNFIDGEKISIDTIDELSEKLSIIDTTTLNNKLKELYQTKDAEKVKQILSELGQEYFNAKILQGDISAEMLEQYSTELASLGLVTNRAELEKQILNYKRKQVELEYKQEQLSEINKRWEAGEAFGRDKENKKILEQQVESLLDELDNWDWSKGLKFGVTGNIEVEYTFEDYQNDYVDLIQTVAGWLIKDEQKKIDIEQEQLDATQKAQEAITNSIEKNINRIRQDRKNAESEQNISDMTRRLAYLRQDTSGSNALEIKKLEQELANATQDYTDDLIDQSLEDLKDTQEKAIEQRQEEIDITKEILEYQKNNGYWNEEAVKYIDDAVSGDNSGLKELFDNNNTNLSAIEQEIDWQNLITTLNNLKTGKGNGWRDDLDTNVTSSEDVSNLANAKMGNLQYGDYSGSENIKILQKALKEIAGYSGDIDGKYGPETKAAVEALLNKMRETEGLEGIGKSSDFGWDGTYWTEYMSERLLEYLKLKGYASGGLADFTGPAWLDGTPSSPEVVLDARDSANLIQLRDILRGFQVGNLTNSGNYQFDININVDELSNDYDVDSLANRIKDNIVSAMSYRNNNFVGSTR